MPRVADHLCTSRNWGDACLVTCQNGSRVRHCEAVMCFISGIVRHQWLFSPEAAAFQQRPDRRITVTTRASVLFRYPETLTCGHGERAATLYRGICFPNGGHPVCNATVLRQPRVPIGQRVQLALLSSTEEPIAPVVQMTALQAV